MDGGAYSAAPAWADYLTWAWPSPIRYGTLPDLAVYDLEHQPTTFDFVTWAVLAKNLGAKTVRFAYEGKIQNWKYPDHVAWKRFEHILAPTCELLGLPWEVGNRCSGFTVGHHWGDVASFARAHGGLRHKITLTAEPHGHVTVTIRESIRNKWRDSNRLQWDRVIAELERRGERVIVIEDVETSGRPMPLDERMRLYSGAKMNLGVNNGPMTLCHLSDAPYLTWMKFDGSADSETLRQHMANTGFPIGSQFEFANSQQLLVWGEDSAASIMQAYDAIGAKPADPWESVEAQPILANVNGALCKITVEGSCVVDNTERYAHCDAAMQSGFPQLAGGGGRVFDAPCVLVGTGPSAVALLPEIRARYEQGQEIIAIKGAHDWLIDNGIIPKAAIALDPQKSRAKCFKRPHADVLYLCASQMHPDTWTHLQGFKVLVWHSRIEAEQEKRPEWAGRCIVPSCSTSGNSALLLMHILGRRNFELYGFDSSIPYARKWHERLMAKIRGRLLKLDGTRTDKRIVTVMANGRHYQTTAELVQQANELQPILRMLGDVTVNAYGDGLYQATLAAGKAAGWPV